MPRASAVRAPATRDQADAYRFGLRRLEAALVRGDPVPLHEQIRSQRRAVAAGALVGLLALGVVAVLALVAPRPDWTRQGIVVGSASGAMYVVAHGPDRLVPVSNLAAGRLVMAALRQRGVTDTDPASATPVVVPDDDLVGAPRTPTAAVPGAVAVRPDGPGVAPRWAVCDRTDAAGRLIDTTVVGGTPLPVPGSPGDGMLLSDPDDGTWLVTGGHRHRIDAGDGALLATFGLTGRVPRAAAPRLLSLLPEGPVLATPQVHGRGRPGPPGIPAAVGDVLATRPVGAGARYFAVLSDGLQEVPPVVAELLRVASGRAIVDVGAEVLASATLVDALPVAGWPGGAPRMLEPAESPVLCWNWTADGDPAGAVWSGAALPLPAGPVPVVLAQADGPGPLTDAVAVGQGGAVRAGGPGGPVWLLSATGVGYRVADDTTAAALGITAAAPAPEAALRLLPAGQPLDLAGADEVVDVPPSP